VAHTPSGVSFAYRSASITFESGPDASQNVLTEQFIYNNAVGSQEEAEVVTSTGDSFRDLCGASGTSGQTNHSAGGGGRGSAADHQYRGEVIPGSIPKRPLPFTGGPPLFEAFIVVGLIGAGLLLLRRT
jgi:hypothetical protein